MIDFTFDGKEFTNAFLNTWFDYVSFDVGAGSIAQSQTSGRNGSGGITFTPNADVTGGNYDLYVYKQLTAQSRRFVGCYVVEGAPQGTLGGRLLTFVDAPEDVFGATVQLAINIMSDGTLQLTRAVTPGSGIILRGIDQFDDSQMALIDISPDPVTFPCYIDFDVLHSDTQGAVLVYVNNELFWEVNNINTAVSGLLQSTTLVWGGYGVTGLNNTTLHHEDLNATISDIFCVNNTINSNDINDPITRVGDIAPVATFPIADATYTQYTPDPVQAHYLNVNEIPPDSGTTENTGDELGLKDNFDMQSVASGSDQVYLAYNAFVKTDAPAACQGVNTPITFEKFVWMESSDVGTCITSTNDTSGCNLSDFVSRRAQSMCGISKEGESAKFKLNLIIQDGMSVCLSPLDGPPQVLNASGPTFFGLAAFRDLLNCNSVLGEVTYALPFFQPWNGVAISTQSMMDTAGDSFEFQLKNSHVGANVGLMDNANALTPFNPYTSTIVSFHFAEVTIGSPFFWIGDGFAYTGQTIYTYSDTDKFKLIRNDPNIELYQNGFLLETFTPGAMPTHINPFAFLGRWGWDNSTSAYTLVPGIKDAIVQIAGSDCVIGNYQQLACVVPGVASGINTGADEASQWGIEFDHFGGSPAGRADATIFDPDGPVSPNTPVFGADLNTVMEFGLQGGNVTLTVTDWVDYADNMTTVIGNIATYVFTRPYADTNDFLLQAPASGFPVGYPTFPFPSLAYELPDTPANAALRLVVNCYGNSAAELPEHAGVTGATQTFVTVESPSLFAGFMRDGNDRSGTSAEVPSADYLYRQSFLATTPSDVAVTPDTFNSGEHGYTDPSE